MDTSAILEVFRRLLLQRLHEAECFSRDFMDKLLSWVHRGFSVFAGPPVEPEALESFESQARYIARPAMAMDAVQERADGTLVLETPPARRPPAARARRCWCWIRSNGFTASRPIFPIPAKHTRRC